MDFSSYAKPQYFNPQLTRPDWTVDTSRDEKLLWLNKNENLDPILNEKIIELLKTRLKPWAINTYPEMAKIYKKLADLNQVDARQLVLTAGSDGSIRNVFDVFISAGDKVLHSAPTFAMYDVYSKIYGAKQIKVDYQYTDHGPQLNFELFIKTIQAEKPKLVCLPNPDSPSGTVLTEDEMNRLIRVTAESGSLLLIDEAYFPFYEVTQAQKVKNNQHLMVCRSFSKAWGAAGVRVGFIIAEEKMAALLHKNRSMYELGTLASEMIYLLLDAWSEVLASVQRLQAGRDYFVQEMKSLGYITTVSHGNFLHVNFGQDEKSIAEALKNVVLYRTEFGGANCLNGFSRFSLGTVDQFKLIVEKIRQIKK